MYLCHMADDGGAWIWTFGLCRITLIEQVIRSGLLSRVVVISLCVSSGNSGVYPEYTSRI